MQFLFKNETISLHAKVNTSLFVAKSSFVDIYPPFPFTENIASEEYNKTHLRSPSNTQINYEIVLWSNCNFEDIYIYIPRNKSLL